MKVTKTTKQSVEVPNVFKDIPTGILAGVLECSMGYASRLRNEKVPYLTYEKYTEMKERVLGNATTTQDIGVLTE